MLDIDLHSIAVITAWADPLDLLLMVSSYLPFFTFSFFFTLNNKIYLFTYLFIFNVSIYIIVKNLIQTNYKINNLSLVSSNSTFTSFFFEDVGQSVVTILRVDNASLW